MRGIPDPDFEGESTARAVVTDVPILVVDPDSALVEALSHYVAGTRRCVAARSFSEGRRRLAAHGGGFCGFAIAAELPDGAGVDMLRLIRAVAPTAPALIVAQTVDAATANDAYALGSACVLKPLGPELLRRFVSDAVAGQFAIDDALRCRALAFARAHMLSPAATELLIAKVAGYTREEILTIRNVSPNTYKSHVRQILTRTGLPTLEHVRSAVIAPPVVAPDSEVIRIARTARRSA